MNLLKKIFNHDSYLFGIVLGTVAPAVFLFVIWYLIKIFAGLFYFRGYDLREIYLLGLIINLVFIRYYIINAKLFKTMQSIVAVSFIWMIVYFVFIK